MWFFIHIPESHHNVLVGSEWRMKKRSSLSLSKKRTSPRWQGANERSNLVLASSPALEPPCSKLCCPSSRRKRAGMTPPPISSQQATPPPGILQSISSSSSPSSSPTTQLSEPDVGSSCLLTDTHTVVNATGMHMGDMGHHTDHCWDTGDQIDDYQDITDQISDCRDTGDHTATCQDVGDHTDDVAKAQPLVAAAHVGTNPPLWGHLHRKPNGIKKQTTLFSFMASKTSSREKQRADILKIDARPRIGKKEPLEKEGTGLSGKFKKKGSDSSKAQVGSRTRGYSNRTCPFYKKIPGALCTLSSHIAIIAVCWHCRHILHCRCFQVWLHSQLQCLLPHTLPC